MQTVAVLLAHPHHGADASKRLACVYIIQEKKEKAFSLDEKLEMPPSTNFKIVSGAPRHPNGIILCRFARNGDL